MTDTELYFECLRGKKDLSQEEKYRLLLMYVRMALRRYSEPSEVHNLKGGWPRGELAWAMSADLEEALERIGEPKDKT